jgi:hypothetical protein
VCVFDFSGWGDRIRTLILRYANGDSAVKRERVQLEGAVQVKLALWRAARCGFDRNA